MMIPCHKRAYDKRTAETLRNARLHRGHRRRRGRQKYLRIYYCPHCNAWHLTHRRISSGAQK